jgi:hypothetical protein
MVVSLYVCEIPKNVDKSDLEELFKSMDGYLECRIKGVNDMRKIAFIDFRDLSQARFSMETLQGFKFSPSDKGLIIKVSDNTKGGTNQSRHKRGNNESPRRQNRSNSLEREKNQKHGKNFQSRNLNERRRKDNEYKNEDDSRGYSRSRSRKHSEDSNYASEKYNPPINNPEQVQNQTNLLDLISILNSNANPSLNLNQSTNKPYTLSETATNQPDTNAFTNLIECLQNLQTVQLLSSLTGTNNTTQENANSKQKESINTIIPSSNVVPTSNQFYNNLIKFDDYFNSSQDFKKNATNIVYVEGLPNDTTEREISHVFRPFVGFKSVRLISREKNGQKSLICFADFEDVMQSTICINTLQGYRFDKNDLVGLHFSYGVNKHKDRK